MNEKNSQALELKSLSPNSSEDYSLEKQMEIVELFGTVDFDESYDYKKSRQRTVTQSDTHSR